MSAVLKDLPRLAAMRETDLDEVLAIEKAVYSHPWTRGNFADSLCSGYACRTWRAGGALIGYFVLLAAAGEAHLLNLSIAAAWQRRGHGTALLAEAMRIGRDMGARKIFLEVRPSNLPGQALYERHGFRKIAQRRNYYPAPNGREDALVLSRAL
ncbi:MAG TPA: ribosomal protein S18-alanine N-acetyltransferase [Burkholderiales bacterium]|nr:ribosomal protein S18-alanine N-acetyltransferase [Burkholderiales bacterium]